MFAATRTYGPVATGGCHRAFEFPDKVVEALADAPLPSLGFQLTCSEES